VLVSLLGVFLIRLLPLGSSQVGPVEVVVATSVLVSVVLQCLLIGSQASLLKFEWLATITHSAERRSACSLKSLIGLERGLEVHPVVSCAAKCFLITQNTQSINTLVRS